MTIRGVLRARPLAIVDREPNVAVALGAAPTKWAHARHLNARGRTQGAHDVWQLAMVLDAPEARQRAEAGPAVNRVARTTETELLHLREWLAEYGVTEVAMEKHAGGVGDLACGKLRATLPALREALAGRFPGPSWSRRDWRTWTSSTTRSASYVRRSIGF